MGFSYKQKVALAILTKIAACLSIIGSSLILQEIVRSKKKLKSMYHRLILAMSISDILLSTTIIVGNYAIPKGTEGVYDPRGNEITCKIQGFFIQFGFATPIYNAVLSLYYLLMIKYNWKEDRLKRLEPKLHGFVLMFAGGTGVSCAFWDQYHNSNLWCWISSTPETKILRWVFFYGPLWLILFFVSVAMVMIYLHVRAQEIRNKKYDFVRKVNTYTTNTTTTTDNNDNNDLHQKNQHPPVGNNVNKKEYNRQQTDDSMTFDNIAVNETKRKNRNSATKHSKRVAVQSFWYVLSFYSAFIFPSLTRLIQTVNGKTYYPILLLFAIFFPLQGFFNFLVYARPKVLQYKKKNKHPTTLGAIGAMLKFNTFMGSTAHESRSRSFGGRKSFRNSRGTSTGGGGVDRGLSYTDGNNTSTADSAYFVTPSSPVTNHLPPHQEVESALEGCHNDARSSHTHGNNSKAESVVFATPSSHFTNHLPHHQEVEMAYDDVYTNSNKIAFTNSTEFKREKVDEQKNRNPTNKNDNDSKYYSNTNNSGNASTIRMINGGNDDAYNNDVENDDKTTSVAVTATTLISGGIDDGSNSNNDDYNDEFIAATTHNDIDRVGANDDNGKSQEGVQPTSFNLCTTTASPPHKAGNSASANIYYL